MLVRCHAFFNRNCCCSSPPANDSCINAITITCGDTITSTTFGATSDTGPTCGTASNSPAGGVWYKFVGTGLSVTFSLCNATTTYDSQLRAFSGSCGSLVCVAGSDDFCGLQSAIAFSATNAVTYYILVHGFSFGDDGPFALTAACTPVAIQEVNYTSANMMVAPNPFSGNTMITMEKGKDISNVSVYAIDGRLVSKLDGLSGNTVELQRNELAAGIYFLEVGVKDGKPARKKIVIE